MPAFVVSLINPLDREGVEAYRAIAAETIAQYGGHYVIRGGLIEETLEGEAPDAKRVIVLEFPDIDRAREWYASPEYAEAKKIRATAMDRTLILAEGS